MQRTLLNNLACHVFLQIIANNSAAALVFPIAATISKNEGVDVSCADLPTCPPWVERAMRAVQLLDLPHLLFHNFLPSPPL